MGSKHSPAPWQELAASKFQTNQSKLPKEWLLPESIISTISQASTQNVLSIPASCGLLSSKEIEITEKYDATELVSKMAARQLSSYEITLAFCKRAAIAQQLTFCLTEMFFDEGLAMAKACDDYLAKEGKTMGPLHGLPISLKDMFDVKGYDSTIGFVSFIGHGKKDKDSVLVQILRNAGAVFYCKTNIPQTMMSADSQNNIFGRTLNPYNLSLTPGGSSGGEGALVALKGSPLGIGTDIAGSIRIPAYCCGTFGLKPSAGRIPYAGTTSSSRAGSPGILSVAGPLARSVRDTELLMAAVINAKPSPWDLDADALAIPWRSMPASSRPLRLGLLVEDSSCPVHPPVVRAMKTASDLLSSAGHEIIPIKFEMSLLGMGKLSFLYFQLDPKQTTKNHITASGEPPIPSLSTTTFPGLKPGSFNPDLNTLYDMNVQRQSIKANVKDLFVANQLDVILLPAAEFSAPPHDTYGLPPYTVLVNLIDHPAISVPFLKARSDDKEEGGNNRKYRVKWDAGKFDGGPTGIQVMGMPLRDEELVRDVGVIADVLGNYMYQEQPIAHL